MKSILIIEDDPAIAKGLKELLTAENFILRSSNDGDEGFRIALNNPFDLILLDWKLPGKSGIDICKDLRKADVNTPIIMLTVRKEEVDKVLGLELGADDYITKPFSPKELVARIRAVLRRKDIYQDKLTEYSFGDVYINFKSFYVTKGGIEIQLSTTEFKILKYLILHKSEAVDRSKLLDEVWGYDAYPTTRTVDNFILSLRKKLEDDPANPQHIITIHKVGYKFKNSDI